jgi:mannan endo-1,4-beta-mannosidase
VYKQSAVVRAFISSLTDACDRSGLGAWEVMNEPEGSVSLLAGVGGKEPCFDPLKAHGVGWTGNNISLSYLQRFVARQAAAIHAADPTVLVTTGSANMSPFRKSVSSHAICRCLRFVRLPLTECLASVL